MRNEDKSINAMPTKAFFVNMLVRDISLERAVLDLLDNCIDGAKNLRPGDASDYSGLSVRIKMDGKHFKIEDNCGGFDIEKARAYAFRFGRPHDADSTDYSIGQFGVGMKRALFKFGKRFEVESTTDSEHWSMHVDVKRWLRKHDNWSFAFDEIDVDRQYKESDWGTTIEVSDLHPEVTNRFESAHFRRQLMDTIQSHQQEFLSRGLSVDFNGRAMNATEIRLRAGGSFQPAIEGFTYQPKSKAPLKVRLVVGVAEPEPSNAGWYVICNGRVILSADRSDYTGWGVAADSKARIPKYTNTFARFRGVVFFNCQDPRKMPWNTTKTGLDDSAVVWQHTYEKMRDHARTVVNFLNAMAYEIAEYGRDESPLRAALLSETKLIDVNKFGRKRKRFTWNQTPPEVGPKKISIQYSKEEEKIEALKDMFKVESARAVGEASFDWAYEALLEDDE